MLFYKCFRSLNSTLKGLGLVLNITSDSFHKHILEDAGGVILLENTVSLL